MELMQLARKLANIELGSMNPSLENTSHDLSVPSDRVPLTSSQYFLPSDSRGTEPIMYSEDRYSSSESSDSSSSDSANEECNLFWDVSNMY